MAGTQDVAEAGEEGRDELGPPVGGDLPGDAETGDPAVDEDVGDGGSTDITSRHTFKPPGLAIDEGDEVPHPVRGLQWTDDVHVE